MGLVIAAKALASRGARKVATGGKPRKLDFTFPFVSEAKKDGKEGELAEKKFDPIGAIKGFISGVIGSGQGFFSNAWGWVVSQTNKLVQFDWNATDEELKAQMDARNEALSRSWGELAGQGFGYVAAIGLGVGVAYAIPVFGGAALAAAVAAGATPEMLEELGSQTKATIGSTLNTAFDNTLINSYMGFRSAIKGGANFVKKVLKKEHETWFTDVWGSESAPRLTIADSFENTIEAMPGGKLVKAFGEGFVEGAFEGFIEGGFIVAGELDLQISMMRTASEGVMGKERTVMVQPDRNSQEKLMVTGSESIVKVEVQSLINQGRLLHNRDIGVFVGEPALNNDRPKPTERIIRIIFKSKQEPPWNEMQGNKTVRSAEMTCRISDVKTSVSWNDIKRAARVFNWGDTRMTAKLDNGRQIAIYGASEKDCTDKLDELMKLTTAKVLRMSFSKKSYANSDPDEKKLRKTATRMYPAYVAVCRRTKVKADEAGRLIAGERYREEWMRYPLYTKAAPDNFII